MRMNWLIMLVMAVIFGAVAVVVANRWLALQSQRAARVGPAPAVQTTTIVVAASEMPFGKQLNFQDLKEIPWPTKSVPKGYFSKISDITKSGRRVALVPLSPNEPILKWKITGPNQRGSLSAVVDPGMRAVAIRVNAIVGVAGFVLPGDRVDLLLTRKVGSGDVTDVLLQNVKVLAIDQLANEKASEPKVSKVVTVEVTSTDAQKITLAQRVGSITLSLRAAGSTDHAPAHRVVTAELTSSSSIYDEQVAARKAAETALNTHIKSLEQTVAQLDQNVQANSAQTKEALQQRQAELQNKIAELQAEFDARVKATGSQAEEDLKQQIAAVRKEIEAKIQASGSQAQTALQQQISAIQGQLDKLTAAGKDDAKLREKLAQLQDALRQSLDASSQGNEALKAKLAALEANLQTMANRKPAAVTMPAPIAPQVQPLNQTMTVKVMRGMRVNSYTVPREQAAAE